MKRVIICILTVTLLIGVLAVPTYAAEFDNDNCVQVLDYGFPDGFTSNLITFSGSRSVSFSLPQNINSHYVEIIFRFSGGTPSVGISGGSSTNYIGLTVVHIGGFLYRAYGYTNDNFYKKFNLNFSSTSSGTSYAILDSFKIYYSGTVHENIRLEASGYYDDKHFDLSLNWGDSRPTQVTFNPSDWQSPEVFFDLYCADWRAFDYVDVTCAVSLSAITSISAQMTNGVTLPFTVSQIYSDGGFTPFYYITVRVDLRGIDRTTIESPSITICGNADAEHINVVSLMHAVGFIEVEVSPLSSFFNRIVSSLNSNFSSLSELLSGFKTDVLYCITTWSDLINNSIASIGTNIVSSVGSVGSKIDNWGQQIVDALVGQKSDDTTISDAIENQEQVNQEVNSQLQSAVGSWSDNVGEVTQGFNLALTNATPALIWISGMAQNVFSGMGWFGNVFFFLGFLHVFFLLMSKSGLGRAIDRADKRGDD